MDRNIVIDFDDKNNKYLSNDKKNRKQYFSQPVANKKRLLLLLAMTIGLVFLHYFNEEVADFIGNNVTDILEMMLYTCVVYCLVSLGPVHVALFFLGYVIMVKCMSDYW